MKLTIDQLERAAAMPAESARLWLVPINRAGEACALNTPKRWAMWLAQCGHECMSFTRMVESLNYTPKGLRATWPSRYTEQLARQHGRANGKPADQRAIANHVYNGRMGNRVGTDDGWKFRGRGSLMLTGADNYRACGDHLGLDLIQTPEMAGDDRFTAVLTSAWFWDTRKINERADTDDLDGATRLINGGLHGLQDRRHRYALALRALDAGKTMADELRRILDRNK